jgi:outer membrane receptor protein involved in Fe transport
MKHSGLFRILGCLLLIFCVGSGKVIAQVPGTIKGKVFDRSTNQPLPGANILVKDSKMGAASDLEGEFVIGNLKAGTYILTISVVGYKARAMTDLVVNPNRITYVEVGLEQDVLSSEEVTVVAGYFIKDKDVVTSTHNLNYEEIRRSVGAAEDVQRVIQALPGVASENDQNNEIVVRGGSPRENLTIMDGIEIPNTNHFGYQGSTGGPINMINTDFLSEVNFLAGGFPAKYGDKLSSVLELELREGNREEIDGNFNFSMAGVGGIFEGPLASGRGSYLLSARKSYLDLINKPLGLTSIPEYWDTQAKITYNLSKTHKVLFNWIYGNDKIKISEEGGYSRGADKVDYSGYQYGAGITIKSLWNKTSFSSLTISQAMSLWDILVDDADGYLRFTNQSSELENCAKYDFTKRISPNLELSAGVNIKQTLFTHEIWGRADTTIYYYWDPNIGDFSSVTVIDSLSTDENIDSHKLGLYLQSNYRLVKNLTLKTGLRYDYFAFSEKGETAPRLGLEWEFIPFNKLTASYGEFYQTPPYFYYTYGGDERNRSLDYEHSRHFVLGYERLFNPGLKGTIELYAKEYDKLALPEEWIYSETNPEYRSNLFVNAGEGYSRGIELFLNQKLLKDFFGTVSYSFGISRYRDPRQGSVLEEYDGDYDFGHIFTLVTGYRTCLKEKHWFKSWRNNPVLGWSSNLLPIQGDEFEFSFRYRYIGGRPFTPQVWLYDLDIHDYDWIEGVLNSERYPNYQRFDIRLDSRYFLKRMTLVIYLEIQNLFGYYNVAQYLYPDDGPPQETVRQWGFFPVGGVMVKF